MLVYEIKAKHKANFVMSSYLPLSDLATNILRTIDATQFNYHNPDIYKKSSLNT